MPSNRVRGRRHAGEHKPRTKSYGPQPPLQKCPVCGKNCYQSRKHAKQAAKRTAQGTPLREYTCTDEWGRVFWHLTSQNTERTRRWRDWLSER